MMQTISRNVIWLLSQVRVIFHRLSSQSIWAATGSEVRQPHVPRLRETSDRQLPVCTDRAKCPRPGLPHRPHNPDCARANHIEHFCHWRYESPRRVRRLHFLGGWSHGRWFNEEVSACLTAASNLKSVGDSLQNLTGDFVSIYR